MKNDEDPNLLIDDSDICTEILTGDIRIGYDGNNVWITTSAEAPTKFQKLRIRMELETWRKANRIIEMMEE